MKSHRTTVEILRRPNRPPCRHRVRCCLACSFHSFVLGWILLLPHLSKVLAAARVRCLLNRRHWLRLFGAYGGDDCDDDDVDANYVSSVGKVKMRFALFLQRCLRDDQSSRWIHYHRLPRFLFRRLLASFSFFSFLHFQVAQPIFAGRVVWLSPPTLRVPDQL